MAHNPSPDPMHADADLTATVDRQIAVALSPLVEHPDPELARTHVARAAAAARRSSTPAPAPSPRVAWPVKAAAAVVAFVVISSGAAYAGVLPDTMSERIGGVIASLGSTGTTEHSAALPDADPEREALAAVAAGETADAVSSPATTGEHTTNERPGAVTFGDDTATLPVTTRTAVPLDPLAAAEEFRDAARTWATCMTASAPDCGDAPRPGEFGLTDEVVAALPAQLLEKIESLLTPERHRIDCASGVTTHECVTPNVPDDAIDPKAEPRQGTEPVPKPATGGDTTSGTDRTATDQGDSRGASTSGGD